jgi:hypothetical protein
MMLFCDIFAKQSCDEYIILYHKKMQQTQEETGKRRCDTTTCNHKLDRERTRRILIVSIKHENAVRLQKYVITSDPQGKLLFGCEEMDIGSLHFNIVGFRKHFDIIAANNAEFFDVDVMFLANGVTNGTFQFVELLEEELFKIHPDLLAFRAGENGKYCIARRHVTSMVFDEGLQREISKCKYSDELPFVVEEVTRIGLLLNEDVKAIIAFNS